MESSMSKAERKAAKAERKARKAEKRERGIRYSTGKIIEISLTCWMYK